MSRTIPIERSRKGIPCLWESGGSYSNTGYVQMIGDNNGMPKKALFVRTKGSLACENHALIPISLGDVVVTVDRHRDDIYIKQEFVVGIEDNQALLSELPKPICEDIINAAVAKSKIYHCRHARYIRME